MVPATSAWYRGLPGGGRQRRDLRGCRPGKIDLLNGGGIPIYEPGLTELVRRNHEAGRLQFTTDLEAGVRHGAVQFIAVGTPPDEDGSADLQHVLAVAGNIGRWMDDYKIIVDKSTVPVGTADRVAAVVRRRWLNRAGTWISTWYRTRNF